MDERTCKVDGCERRAAARQMCKLHWRRFVKTGTTALRPESRRRPGNGPKATPPIERLLARISVDPESGCWEWLGHRNVRSGYGVIGVGRRTDYTHRVAYAFFVSPIPDGHHIDHLCRNRGCCCPDHLQAVEPAENIRRIPWASSGSANRAKTHCVNGHEFTPENTSVGTSVRDGKTKTQRRCKECLRLSAARRRRGPERP